MFRGGVLEPEGIVEIKFRKKDLLKTMHRIDAPLASLDAEIVALNLIQQPLHTQRKCSLTQQILEPTRKSPELMELEKKVADREKSLMGIYHQIAVHFADLHDTPERMHEKGTIQVC